MLINPTPKTMITLEQIESQLKILNEIKSHFNQIEQLENQLSEFNIKETKKPVDLVKELFVFLSDKKQCDSIAKHLIANDIKKANGVIQLMNLPEERKIQALRFCHLYRLQYHQNCKRDLIKYSIGKVAEYDTILSKMTKVYDLTLV